MMVASEEGVSIQPDYCTYKLYQADNLVRRPLVGEGNRRRFLAVWRKDQKRILPCCNSFPRCGYRYSVTGVTVFIDSKMGL